MIKEEIVQTEIDLSDIEKFREKYSKELLKENDQNESAKYSVNELEIAYNLLYVSVIDLSVINTYESNLNITIF